ncbi:hypothetical protein SBOR_5022 [Sclerotinia borealis F-4128]|uniref:Aminoglycoside phosphotransferase domain-containing protein n=1 Tax=Sclerotinia borealis (strain F-4128) TaxID=1432307 RepID=W9CFG8_SCLBF|nr:hypothetical protein SBOR_5022 [Sclerotinia borealis F-4128]
MSGNFITNPFPSSLDGIEQVTAVIEEFGQDIGFGHDVENCEVVGGSNNYVVMFSYIPDTSSRPGSREKFILRTRKNKLIDTTYMVDDSTARAVAVMHTYGHGGPSASLLPIPAILAYDGTCDNPIKCPFIIQRKAAGKTLEEHYKILNSSIPSTDSYDLTERLKFAEEIAKLIANMENNFTFSEYGRLNDSGDMPSSDMDFVGSTMKICIYGTPIDTDDMTISTKPDYQNFISSLVDAWTAPTTSHPTQAYLNDLSKLRQIFEEMSNAGLFGRYNHTPTLFHPDLYPRNVIFDCVEPRDIELTAVIDWDDAVVLPRIMTRKPPYWLWNRHRLPPSEQQTIKRHFYDYIERLIPGYRNEADGREAVLLRALSMYAFRGPGWRYHRDLRLRIWWKNGRM